MSKKKLSYREFKAYFSNTLQSKAKHDFEKEMMRDTFEEEAFDGLSKLNHEELENDISGLKAEILNKTKKSRILIPTWFKYAASVLILIGIGLSLLLFNNNFWQDSVLTEQISEEIGVADSLVLEIEKEMKQLAGETSEVSDSIANENLIAESRKKEKQSEKVKTVTVEEKRFNEIVTDEDSEKEEMVLETEVDEDVSIEIVEFEEEEKNDEPEAFAVIADKSDYKEENKVSSNLEINEALSEQASGVRIEKKEDENRRIVIRGAASIPSKKSKQSSVIENGITIKGKILAAEDELSIPGVSITLKDNPNIGTITNIEGEFTITIPENGEELKILIASFVGMESMEINLDGDSNLLVYMEPSLMVMDEVVATAYGVSNNVTENTESKYKSAQPSEVGTLRKYKKQILENLDYSKLAEYSGKHKIKVVLRLSSYGIINDVEFKNSPNFVFDQEIERVMRNLGSWNPAEKNGEKTSASVRFTLKIEIE